MIACQPFSRTVEQTAGGLPQLDQASAEALMEWADCRYKEGLVASTSFGIQSAVTLHLATRVRPDLPVVWVDTGYLPPETYDYAEQLSSRLHLNLHVYQADLSPARMEARHGRLWETGRVEDLDLYDRLRKVEPMQRALDEWHAQGWISGLRREQTQFRRTLSRVEHKDGRHKILPILHWSNRDVYQYMLEHELPQHPLWEQGYTTVGDWHSSRAPSSVGSTGRETRFGGLKEECGLHL